MLFRLCRWFYTAVFVLVLPLLLLRLLQRSRKDKGYRQRMGQRLAFGLPRLSQPSIWFHAVSVGEVIASAPLVRALMDALPNYTFVLTATTATGSREIQRLYGETVRHYYMPFDLPWVVTRFIQRLAVRVIVVMETEIWPNLVCTADRLSVPLLLANGRLSPQSFRSYARIRWLMAPLLSRYHQVMVRDETDAAYFSALGVSPEQLRVAGNIKYDIEINAEVRLAADTLRSQWGGRPTWIAASTHAGEEAVVLAAHQRVLAIYPTALLILVPRHLARFDAVAKLVTATGLSLARRSMADLPQTAAVYLGDTMGEMLPLMGAADVVMMGGSLVNVGGHNFAEPAALGKPLLSGPILHNFVALTALLQAADALQLVENETDIAESVISLFADAERAAGYATRAKQVIEQNRGAVVRHVAQLMALT